MFNGMVKRPKGSKWPRRMPKRVEKRAVVGKRAGSARGVRGAAQRARADAMAVRVRARPALGRMGLIRHPGPGPGQMHPTDDGRRTPTLPALAMPAGRRQKPSPPRAARPA
jgi:hypothetical protein